jgi:hypothetical protein
MRQVMVNSFKYNVPGMIGSPVVTNLRGWRYKSRLDILHVFFALAYYVTDLIHN